ncbi:hypothetical protein [Actinocrispum sp. NPDC049592]|uniref:hypothetical protein n=1 Tax=Actinocrispum sp. NPDC049592 TaxID=3154835 RepID=UPI003415EA72
MVIHYSERLLNKRPDILLPVLGAALVVLGLLPVPEMPATRQLIVMLVFAAGTFACCPSALKARRRQQTALKNAQELLATPVVAPLGQR